MRIGIGRAILCAVYLRREAMMQWYAGSDFRSACAWDASDVHSSVIILHACPESFSIM